MSENKPNKRLISEKEMLAYLDGRVKGPEANQIERQLLDSSFEEDALEGYSSLQSSEIKKDLQNLKEKLESRNNYRKPGYLSIAATVAFLIATFGSIWFVMENALPNSEISLKQDLESPADEPTLAEAQTDTTTREIAMISESSIEETAGQESESDIGQVSVEANPELIDSPSEEVIVNDDVDQIGDEGILALNDAAGEVVPEPASIPTSEPEAPVEEAIAVSFDETVSEPIQANDVESVPAEKLLATPSRSATAITSSGKAIVVGTVYSAKDQEPIMGVTVSWDNIGTVTDINGQFELEKIPEDAELSFSMVGMKSKKVVVNAREELKVNLEEDVSSLSEVVVVGYGSSAKQDEAQGITVPPKPIDGERAFKEYIKSSIVYPEDARSQNIKGNVTLRITISSEGKISNVEIVRSLFPSCDLEAIRLIREGPDWNPSTFNGKPIEGSVNMKINFKPN